VQQKITAFKKAVWDYYRAHKRPMPWRQKPTPYNVLVSEIMLQQTQVPRVQQKFVEFTQRFPGFTALAAAPFSDVLAAWSGLGYNRRAKYLWQSAKKVVGEYHGELPHTLAELTALPGVGPNTAGAILAYAYNQPVVFIETNIRTVVIHHFFADQAQKVSDKQISQLVEATLDYTNPREWYWALMDYGTHLKATVGGQLQRVQAYRPQSRFAGSRRQVRGQVLRALIAAPTLSTAQLAKVVADERLPEVLESLKKEGLIAPAAGRWHLTRH
jgi:A/G-specific adenine glycosylase